MPSTPGPAKDAGFAMDRPVALIPHAAVRRIREMIREGELKPGDALPSERLLSQRLGLSRASLREALSTLETLGVLRAEPRRGTFVADASQAEEGAASWRFERRYSAAEFYQFRLVTEGYAARLAAMRTTPDQATGLRGNLRDMTAALQDGDLVTASQIDFEFHLLIMRMSGNRVFPDLWANYGPVLLESQRLPFARPKRVWEPVVEHENVVQAIEHRDPDGAAYFMHVHLIRAADRIGVVLNDRA